MASVGARAWAALRLPTRAPGLAVPVLVVPALLGIARLLPAHGAGLGLRLAAAGVLVLLVPGALVSRALGRPERLGVALAAALAWSLLLVFAALALTFAAGGPLSLTVALLAVLAAGALAGGARAPAAPFARADRLAAGGLAAAGILLAGLVWWAASEPSGESLLHLGRARKLDELPELTSVQAVSELRDGGLHPGYAFPLWHGVLALVSRLAGVDTELVVLHLSALLAPLALLLAYAAGSALFASAAGGVAVALAQTVLVVFPDPGAGALERTSLPAAAALLLLVPALFALVLAFVRDGSRPAAAAAAACSLALALTHPVSAAFAAVPLAGFGVARLVLARGSPREAPRLAAAIALVLVPLGMVLAWLAPVVRDTAAFRPDAGERVRELSRHAADLELLGDSARLSPDAIVRGGMAVAALVAIPLAVLAGRRRHAAFVAGGSLAVLAILLAPPLFTAVADLATVAQARRLALFLPLPFALALGLLFLGRLRAAGCLAAAGLGTGLALAYPGEAGPAWVAWAAVVGCGAALAGGRLLRRPGPPAGSYTVAAACLLALPAAILGLGDLERRTPDPRALTPGLVETLRERVPPRAVVLAEPAISYRIAASAPVYVVALPRARSLQTASSRSHARRVDVARFFGDGGSYFDRARILAAYGASWVVADSGRPAPRYLELVPTLVYEDERFALYRLRRP